MALLVTALPCVADESPSIPASSLHSEFWSHVEREEFDVAAALMIPIPAGAAADVEQKPSKLREIHATIFETIIRDLGALRDRTRVPTEAGDTHWLRYEVNLDAMSIVMES